MNFDLNHRPLLIGAAVMVFFLSAAKPVDAQQLVSSMEYPIISWTNMARQYYGRAPVTANPQLTRAAQMHALNMAAQETMSHTLNGMNAAHRVKIVGYPYAAVGENVAYNFGYQNPSWSLFQSWLISPGHLQNILSAQFTEIGVGVAYSATGKFYACQVFGRPATATSPAAAPYRIYGNYPARMPQEDPSFYYLLSDGF